VHGEMGGWIGDMELRPLCIVGSVLMGAGGCMSVLVCAGLRRA
jgi:hypothetical protein